MPGKLEALADSVILAVRSYLGRELAKVVDGVATLERRVEAIPAGARGEQGIPGQVGPQGQHGERGIDGIGDQGPQGHAGRDGADGVGMQGPQGHQGHAGRDGVDGTGHQGPQGDRGDAGQDGSDGTGHQGPQGDRGDAGQDGSDGVGERGAQGHQGPAGVDGIGERGVQGVQGPAGADGIGQQGAQGVEGARGERGMDGVGQQGAQGKEGASGERGADGVSVDPETVRLLVMRESIPVIKREFDERMPLFDARLSELVKQIEPAADGANGAEGPAGRSAFDLARASGFVGSEAEWLLSIRGKDGADGEAGKDGIGRDGVDGRDGRDGERGDNGRDAIEIDVLDGIDESRSYPRGTFAAFAGGTFRASRATDPLGLQRPRDAGWMSMLRGVASDVETLEDGGRFRIRTVTYSDGEVSVQRSQTAMQINRGVYSAGKHYEPGDVVTTNGSQFCAFERTNAAPPGGAWKLVVKHGRDGKI